MTTGSRRNTTVSKELAITARMLLVSMGFSVSIRKIVTPDTTVIEGRTVNQRDYYTVNRSNNPLHCINDDNHKWFKAKKFSMLETPETVYNIEVAEDHSYPADGIVVHNCQPFSSAGLRKGHKDERNLWPEFYRLIRACQPAVIFGEQVSSSDVIGLTSGILKDPDSPAWIDVVCTDLERA
jgi:hypothetical protein